MAAGSARRPLGITLLSVLILLVAIAHTVIVLQYLGIIDSDVEFPGGDWVGAIVFLINLALALWVGVGLWRLNSGAWIFVNLLAVFGIVSAFMAWLSHSGAENLLAPLLISLAILIYCNTRPVRAAFRV